MTLRGHAWTVGNDWVVLVHDRGRDLDVWRDLPALLVDQGYSVLAMDLPGHGLSDDPPFIMSTDSAFDAMIDRVGPEARRVFVVAEGASADAALSATLRRSVDALVALSPKADGGGARGVPECPKLFMVGTGDSVALEQTNRAFRAAGGWTVRSAFPVVEQGADLLKSDWGTHVVEQILIFLRDYRQARSR